MAGTTINARPDAQPNSQSQVTTAEHNKLVTDLETLRAAVATMATKLNADAGVTDTNYAAPAAATLTAARVANQSGVVIS